MHRVFPQNRVQGIWRIGKLRSVAGLRVRGIPGVCRRFRQRSLGRCMVGSFGSHLVRSEGRAWSFLRRPFP